MKQMLNLALLLTGLLSAFFWVMSAFVKVRTKREDRRSSTMSFRDASITIDGNDLAGTLRRQAFWNSLAASTAAVTAVLQVLVNWCPEGS
jgi:hypothetical protein